jgi:molecular chaperone GrpE
MVNPNDKKGKKRKEDMEKKETATADKDAAAQTAQQDSAQPEQEARADAAEAQNDGSARTDEAEAAFEKAIAGIISERDAYLEMARRLQADFENYKKRTASTRAEALAEGKREVCAAMLPVLDNLERAAQAAGEQGAVAEGVALVLKQLRGVLESLGVCEIPACGEAFDPNLHHAVMQAEKEGAEEGTVVDVLQKGYSMGDSVLRYAMVTVAK